MKYDAKKIAAIARTEGTAELYLIQCDTCVLPDNPQGVLVAVLEWGNLPGHGGMRYVQLRPELQPLPIPEDLAVGPKPDTIEALRIGFGPLSS